MKRMILVSDLSHTQWTENFIKDYKILTYHIITILGEENTEIF